MNNSQKVIWIPQYSGNRTAFLSTLTPRINDNFKDKNTDGVYPVAPFDFWKEDNKYYSKNPNCGTVYRLLEVPEWFTDYALEDVATILQNHLGKNYGKGNEIRAIKMGRENLITEIISRLK